MDIKQIKKSLKGKGKLYLWWLLEQPHKCGDGRVVKAQVLRSCDASLVGSIPTSRIVGVFFGYIEYNFGSIV